MFYLTYKEIAEHVEGYPDEPWDSHILIEINGKWYKAKSISGGDYMYLNVEQVANPNDCTCEDPDHVASD